MIQEPSRPKRLLIVEDDPGIVALYRAIFRKRRDEFACDFATSGDAAVAFLKDNEVDAVILEWELPGAGGITVLREIRKQPATAALPLFVVTKALAPGTRVMALLAGADDYASKPISMSELLERLRRLLS